MVLCCAADVNKSMLVKSPALVSLLLDATFVAGLHMERPGEKEALFGFESSQDPQSEAEEKLAAANKQQTEDRIKMARGQRDLSSSPSSPSSPPSITS